MWYSCENERLKGCVDSYISILTKTLISSIQRGCFLNQLKLVEVTPDLKKEDELVKKIISQLVFFPTHLRYLKK